MVTSSPNATTVASRVNKRSIQCLTWGTRPDSCSGPVDQPAVRLFASLLIGQHDLRQLFDPLGRQAVQRVLDNNRDVGETNASAQKGLDGYFIGGVEDGTGRAAGIEGLPRQAQTGKTQRIRRLEIQPRGQ